MDKIEEIYNWMIKKGYDRKASKDVSEILLKYLSDNNQQQEIESLKQENEKLKEKLEIATKSCWKKATTQKSPCCNAKILYYKENTCCSKCTKMLS